MGKHHKAAVQSLLNWELNMSSTKSQDIELVILSIEIRWRGELVSV